jgi:hypothetical protein
MERGGGNLYCTLYRYSLNFSPPLSSPPLPSPCLCLVHKMSNVFLYMGLVLSGFEGAILGGGGGGV